MIEKSITLREPITLKYAQAYSFNKIITFTDLPYNFDQINKVWWRWYSEIYGFFYHRVKRSYSVWLTTYLKKNIGVYLPFYFKMPSKKSKILDNWRRRVFLYAKTLDRKLNNIVYKKTEKLNFWLIDYNTLAEPAKEILLTGNRSHRQINSTGIFGLELNMFISSYNAKWNNLYKPEASFYNLGRMPQDFLIVVNNFFISSGFFINSYDSQLMLYPQYFLEYSNKIYSKKYIDLINFFELKFNLVFYYNILILISRLFCNLIRFKFFKYVNLNIFSSVDFMKYKFNLYIFFLRYLKFFYRKILNVNFFMIYLIFLNKYNFSKIVLFKNIKEDKVYNSFNIIYNVYFSNCVNNKYSWILNNSLKNKKIFIYDYLYKYLNRFSLFKLNLQNNYKNSIYLRKLYIIEWIYLWEILNRYTIRFGSMNRKKQSKYFINKYTKILRNKYEQLKDIYSILSYLNNIKSKLFKFKLSNNLNLTLIRPSIKIINQGLITKLTWVTFFGKHFVTIPDQYKYLKNTMFFFANSINKFKYISYIKYTKFYLQKIKNFLVNFSTLLINNLKLNFGFSYSLFRNNNFNNYYFYNLQYYIYIFFSFIKKYFQNNSDLLNIKNSFNVKTLNIFDKFFFFFLQSSNRKNNKINIKLTTQYKGINLNTIGYLKFINKF